MLLKPRILVKYPTRERARRAYIVLKEYIEQSTSPESNHYLVSYDANDKEMNNPQAMNAFYSLTDNITLANGQSANKVHAYNRDIANAPQWDILVVASDDMYCQKQGWDDIIRAKFTEHFPDFDGVLHFNDGYVGERLNTLPILGSTYYNRFGYVYHPAYHSLWCDNLFMDVANKLGKQKYFDEVLFKHEHPMNNGGKQDALLKRTERYYDIDKKVYDWHKQTNYRGII